MEPTKPTPEQAPVPTGSAEQLVAPAEQAPAAPAAPAPPIVPLTVSTDSAPVVGSLAVITATPATAGDVDVLEKEWVDKTETVINKTAGDPHAEEAAVEDLQIDYMKKRYNKDIKKAEG